MHLPRVTFGVAVDRHLLLQLVQLLLFMRHLLLRLDLRRSVRPPNLTRWTPITAVTAMMSPTDTVNTHHVTAVTSVTPITSKL